MQGDTRQHRFLLGVFIAAATAFTGALGAAAPAGVIVTTPLPSNASPPSINHSGIEVSATLERQVRQRGKADFAIEFRDRADLSAAAGMNWNERGRYVYQRLRETAERSQADARRALHAQGLRFEPYWIKNAIVVHDGDLAALAASSRFDGVQRIRELPDVKQFDLKSVAKALPAAADGIGDNIRHIGAAGAWAQGTTGHGVTVGIIDNGFRYTQAAIVKQYRGNHDGIFDHDYNWFEPSGHSSEPRSLEDPHGTHVTGTIVGDDRNIDPARRNRIGVAPGAQWIGCLGTPSDHDPRADLLQCGQFMLAPTRTDGTDANPDLRPQVVNNSWSEGTCNGTTTPFYADVVESWVAAGIFPVFAAGNTFSCNLPEPHLSTVSSPAALASAFAVGSTGNHDGEYATHSLWGPTTDSSPGLPHYPDPRGFPRLKPQVVAPGVDIRSASDEGDDSYLTMTGTSMSSPHIVGLVALMLEAGECLRGDYATLGTLIMQTARAIPYDTGGDPAPGPGNVPNYATGWGEIDVPAAVTAASNACGPQGFIAGKVTSSTGAPIAAAKVEFFVDPAVKVYEAITESDGRFIRRVPQLQSGGYTMRVSAYGYLPSSESGILVDNGATTQRDAQLAVASVYKISGRVTDATTGWPLHARVRIGGYPGEAIWTDPVSGVYSARLAEGTRYRFDVDSGIPGYLPQSRDMPSVSGGASVDFTLPADLVACSAPGYRSATTLLSENFDNANGAPPPGWSRSSRGLGWLFGDSAALSAPTFEIPEHGRFAATDDILGGDTNDGRADLLTMPALNLSAVDHPVLRYASYTQPFGPRATVEASLDGGATWATVGAPRSVKEVEPPWADEILSLAAFAGPNVRLRFHSDDHTTDENGGFISFGWAIDDVQVTANCTPPPPGGLVVGHVRDMNTGAALDAALSVDGGGRAKTFDSPDRAVGQAFFAAYAPAGSPLLTAKHEAVAGYGEGTITPAVSAGKTTLADIGLPAGRLRLHPSNPAATVPLGSTATVPFTVTNSGTRDLHFGFEQAAVEEHFESPQFPPPGWTTQTAAGACGWRVSDPHNDPNYAGGDGRAAIISTLPCNGGYTDSSLITSALDLSRSHTASIGFFLYISIGGGGAPQFDVDVSRDGSDWSTLFTQTTRTVEDVVAPIELDLTPFVGSSNVRVRFRYRSSLLSDLTLIDQVHLFNGVSMSSTLHLSPEYGALAAGESRTLDATFDARAITQPGTYTLPIRVAEDTPYDWPFGDVEAKMTVTAPASYGSIGGVVQSLGRCDVHPLPLKDAQVTITAAGGAVFTTTTAADGSYRYWGDPAHGPFTVDVVAAGHATASRAIAISAGNAADGAFGLRVLQPCLLADPATLSASVASGQSLQQPFALMNAGAAGADWTLRTGGDPNVRSLVQLRQTNGTEPTQNSSIICNAVGTPYALDNRYMRVFPLAERGLPDRDVLVTGLSFAIDTATGVQGTQPIDLRLYALSGELRRDNLVLLREKAIQVADTHLQRMSVAFDEPLSLPGSTVLVAEIHVPGNGREVTFVAGGNQLGESAPGYLLAPACRIDEPTTYAEIDPRASQFNLILEIDTQAPDPCGPNATAVDWLGVSQASGHVDADAAAPLQASLLAGSRADGSYQGSMCVTPGKTTAPIVVPVTMHVGAGGDAIFRNGFD